MGFVQAVRRHEIALLSGLFQRPSKQSLQARIPKQSLGTKKTRKKAPLFPRSAWEYMEKQLCCEYNKDEKSWEKVAINLKS